MSDRIALNESSGTLRLYSGGEAMLVGRSPHCHIAFTPPTYAIVVLQKKMM